MRKLVLCALAVALFSALPTTAMAHPPLTFASVTGVSDNTVWGTNPNDPCNPSNLYIAGVGGNILNPDGTINMEIENGVYTFNLAGSGSAAGPVFQLALTFENNPAYEILVSYNTETGQFTAVKPSVTVLSVTLTVTDFRWASGGQADSVGYCNPSHDGVADSTGYFTVVVTQTAQLAIDIRPGKFPNTINLSSDAAVPVAIMSLPLFDARTIDPQTIRLAGAPVRQKGKQPYSADVNGDGFPDLVVYIDGSQLQLTPSSTQATLTGRTFEAPGEEGTGINVVGFDSVKVVQ